MLIAAAEVSAQDTAAGQRVVITGSYLARDSADALVPVTVLHRADAERAGHATLGEWLASLPYNNGGSSNPANADGGSNPGYASLTLRGAGASATLVLVNGHRVAPFAFSGVAVDLNALPLAAIERVEIMRDGGSALYGAEAVAGVVNVILRRGFDGIEARLSGQRTAAGGASQKQLTLTAGRRADASSSIDGFILFDFREQSPLPAARRAFGRSALRPEQNFDQTSAFGFPGAYAFDLSTPYVDFSSAGLDCDAQRYPGAVPSGTMCRHDYPVLSSLLPAHRATSLFARAQQGLNAGTTWRIEALLADNRYRYRTSATPIWGGFTSSQQPFVLPESSPYNPFGQDVQFFSRTVELGPRTTDSNSTGWRLSAGLDLSLGSWLWGVSAGTSGSRARLDLVDGYLSESGLRSVLATGGRINPFGDTAIADRQNWLSASTRGGGREALALAHWLDARGSVELGRWGGRPVELATGVEWRRESLRDEPSALLASGDVLGQAGSSSPLAGSRTVQAIYGELSWPVFAGMAMQASGRWDAYSDFGQRFSPKLAVSWSLLPSISLRASTAKSFRAPSLSELYTAQTSGLSAPLDDPLRCPGGTALPGADPVLDCQASFNQLGGGNPQLGVERAATQSIGLSWRAAPGLRFEVGGWRIDKRGDIGIVRDSTALDPAQNAALAALVHRLPASAADVANGLPGRIAVIDVRFQNLGRSRLAGWDFELHAGPADWAGGKLEGSWTAARMTQAEQWLADGGAHVVLLDASVNGTPVQRWRHAATLHWQRQAWSWSADIQGIDSYRDENLDAQGAPRRVARWWTLGLSAALRIGTHEWSLGVTNVFNQDPPFSNKTSSFAAGWDDLVHDPRGRTVWLAWKVTNL